MDIYTPKISPSRLKMTSERLLSMSIKFYTSPKNFIAYPQNKFLATPLAVFVGVGV